ncbi:glycosyltransferase family 9 protein [Burkholderia sp. BCC1999]|uniref:glycosyltransferase family 9 protein n=1 Tax=Burkholderia sp. BCC1999 TaxID=2817448 RepID=UPI002AC31240|nr:glycosyltransferase family 9 protein [Burkholderia sp. BCC1999]
MAIAIMSLPLRCGTTLDTIPAVVPYLHVPAPLVEHWRSSIPEGGLKVGLVWAGDPRPDQAQAHATDRRRSLPASAYLPLLQMPGVSFVSLQKGETTRRQIDTIPSSLRPVDPMEHVRDFADTAAIIAHLDLVITVDTSVAHVAGALGKPVWILSRFDGCWRWLADRDDSPWYPQARLFRQSEPGQWSDVVERVAGALEHLRAERELMKRPIYFCKSWFRAKKRPTEIWSEEQARSAHVNGQLYTVLVDSVEQPYCFIEVTAKAIGLGFLDDLLRESLSYDFQEVEPGKLFLSMATYREFDGGTDRVISRKSYIFARDGGVTIRREFFDPHRIETATSSADVRPDYSAVPEFGEYDDLVRVERG